MFKRIITAVLKEILVFMVAHKTLLEQNADARKGLLKYLAVSGTFVDYLTHADKAAFMEDMREAVAFIEQGTVNSSRTNGFLTAFVDFMTGKVALGIDAMSTATHFTKEGRDALAKKLVPGDNAVSLELRRLLLTYSYQELAGAVAELSKSTVGAPYILVQSPREIDIELKKDIRETLVKNGPHSFPIFQINRSLIGGFRVFKDGENIDYSWISRVLRFTSLTSA